MPVAKFGFIPFFIAGTKIVYFSLLHKYLLKNKPDIHTITLKMRKPRHIISINIHINKACQTVPAIAPEHLPTCFQLGITKKSPSLHF